MQSGLLSGGSGLADVVAGADQMVATGQIGASGQLATIT
jgi:hypothetical protein